MGITKTDATITYDMSGNISVEDSKVKSSDITINVESIEYVMQNIDDFASEHGYLKGLSFDEVLAVVVGHEIEHTTLENAITEASGGDDEAKPTEVGEKIAGEIKEGKNEVKD